MESLSGRGSTAGGWVGDRDTHIADCGDGAGRNENRRAGGGGKGGCRCLYAVDLDRNGLRKIGSGERKGEVGSAGGDADGRNAVEHRYRVDHSKGEHV